jgi:hypothetical protein
VHSLVDSSSCLWQPCHACASGHRQDTFRTRTLCSIFPRQIAHISSYQHRQQQQQQPCMQCSCRQTHCATAAITCMALYAAAAITTNPMQHSSLHSYPAHNCLLLVSLLLCFAAACCQANTASQPAAAAACQLLGRPPAAATPSLQDGPLAAAVPPLSHWHQQRWVR